MNNFIKLNEVPEFGGGGDGLSYGNLHRSECGAYIEATFFANDYDVNFCPNCGARMLNAGTDEAGKIQAMRDKMRHSIMIFC